MSSACGDIEFGGHFYETLAIAVSFSNCLRLNIRYLCFWVLFAMPLCSVPNLISMIFVSCSPTKIAQMVVCAITVIVTRLHSLRLRANESHEYEDMDRIASLLWTDGDGKIPDLFA